MSQPFSTQRAQLGPAPARWSSAREEVERREAPPSPGFGLSPQFYPAGSPEPQASRSLSSITGASCRATPPACATSLPAPRAARDPPRQAWLHGRPAPALFPVRRSKHHGRYRDYKGRPWGARLGRLGAGWWASLRLCSSGLARSLDFSSRYWFLRLKFFEEETWKQMEFFYPYERVRTVDLKEHFPDGDQA